MEPFVSKQDASLLQIRTWEERYPDLVAGFTTRQGGISKQPYDSLNCALHVGDVNDQVVTNRKLLSYRLGFVYDMWTCSEQVHGSEIAIVSHGDAGKGRASQADAIIGVDGMLTAEKGVLLTSFYADCVPLLFLSPRNQVIGVAHAGWKGTAANISKRMVDALVDQFNAAKADIQVMIGPSIGGCCYEVAKPVVDAMNAVLETHNEELYTKQLADDKYLLDLKAINKLLLLQEGLADENIQMSNWCTSCRTDLFYSYRKEGGQTGRMTAYIGWRKEG